MSKNDKGRKERGRPLAKPKASLDKLLGRKGLDLPFGDILGNPGGKLGNIIERGPNNLPVQAPAVATSALTQEKGGDISLSDFGRRERSPLSPTEDETLAYRSLYSVCFGDFVPGARTYARAKYIDDHNGDDRLPPALEQFADNPSADIDPSELRPVGWEAVKGLLKKLSSAVFKLKFNEGKPLQVGPGEDIELARTEREREQNLVREKEIVPIITKFYKDHSMFNVDWNEEQIRAEVNNVLPGFELVVNTVMHDKQDGFHLLTAMDKKVHGKDLSPTDQQMLKKHARLVNAWDSLLYSAGWGLASAPCNQVYSSIRSASATWEDYVTDDRAARAAALQGNKFQAGQKWRDAMVHHDEALEYLTSASKALNPLCERLERMLDFNSAHELPDAVLDKAEKTVRSMATFSRVDGLDYARNRMLDGLKSVKRHGGEELEDAHKYCERAMILSAMAGTLEAESDSIVKDINHIRTAIPGDQRKVKLSEPAYRNANHGMRTMMHRLEMVQMSAEDLYADLANITGKNEQGWKSFRETCEHDGFIPPAKPRKELVELADRVQRYCVTVHKEAENRWRGLQEMTNQFYGGDKFDIILDLFQRLRSDINSLAASMQKREDYWKSQNTGVGSGPA